MTATYTHNGNGQRVMKNVSGAITIFHYSLNGQIIAESNSAGTITAEYVYLNGQPLAKMEGANTYYYHNDHLATPQKMTDSSGVVRWFADYKPFGEAAIDTQVTTITNNLRFPGQYFDAETGLNYNYFRDYNPAIGRYVEADPIGLRGGNNLYIYARQNPGVFTDLRGLEPCEQVTDWREVSVLKNPNTKSTCGPSSLRSKWAPDGYQQDGLMNCLCYWKLTGVERVYTERCFTEQAQFKCKKKNKCGKETTYTETRSRQGREFGEWVVPVYPVIANLTAQTKGTWTDNGCWCLDPDGN
jgi:RHS repeat-associated protein